MVQIKTSKGLDIPISGQPSGDVRKFIPSGEAPGREHAMQIALNLDPFEGVRFRLLAKQGDAVKIGQPILEDKGTKGRYFVSPAGGVITEVRRGLKRRLLDMVIRVKDDEEYHEHGKLDVQAADREQLIQKLLDGGLFAHIRTRPFNRLADPYKTPRSIFVKAIESAPFTPPAEMQAAGNEEAFQTGLTALSKLTDGQVHLVYRHDSSLRAFTEAKDVQRHTAEGPHPVANHSVHISRIDPIRSPEDIVWTLSVLDVIAIGHFLNTGRYFIDRVISIAGPGILEGRTGYFKVRAGYPISLLISGNIPKGLTRFISGDPLMGMKVDPEDFLGFSHTVFCAIPENVTRQFMHFFRLGANRYSYHKAYLSGHFDNSDRTYPFTTSQHGEERAVIDGGIYDGVMPLPVPTMPLVKAVMAEDYDLAEELGLLDVDPEDFALPTFICPSKLEMVEIIKEGQTIHAGEVLE